MVELQGGNFSCGQQGFDVMEKHSGGIARGYFFKLDVSFDVQWNIPRDFLLVITVEVHIRFLKEACFTSEMCRTSKPKGLLRITKITS